LTPAQKSALSSSRAATSPFKNVIGAQPPIGFWDPLGLLDDASEERFNRLRDVENKHGRIAQLAILGHLVTGAGIRFPGELGFGLKYSDVPAGLKAIETHPEIAYAFIFFIGIIELGYNAVRPELEATQLAQAKAKYGWDDATIEKKKAIELNNGRAAQMGILAMMVHEKLNNDPYIINTLLGKPVPFNVGF